MRDFLIEVFSWKYGNLAIECFNIWHFAYCLLIAGAIVGVGFLLKGKSERTKDKALKILCISVLVSYIIDFMLQPFVSGADDFTLNIDKLPFHICTAMSIVAVFAQYSKKEWFKEVAVMLSIAGSLMYLVFPNTALGGKSPFCYKVVQTMLYHGALLAWGVLSLTSGQVKLHIKKMWQPLVGLCCLATWAMLGNVSFNGGSHHWDWMFLTGSTFDFVPSWLMPFVVIACVYGVIACVYLIYWIVCKIISKNSAKRLESQK